MNPPEPPSAGWLWHAVHWSPLNLTPNPDELVCVTRLPFAGSVNDPSVRSLHSSHTPSSCSARFIPSLNIDTSIGVNPLSAVPAPGAPCRNPGSFCARHTPVTVTANSRHTNSLPFPLKSNKHDKSRTAVDRLFGTDQITPQAEATILYVDLKKGNGVVRLLSSSADDTTASKINATGRITPLKPAGEKVWETVFPLAEVGPFPESAVWVMWLFGWGITV
jgi:hypothetical protein